MNSPEQTTKLTHSMQYIVQEIVLRSKRKSHPNIFTIATTSLLKLKQKKIYFLVLFLLLSFIIITVNLSISPKLTISYSHLIGYPYLPFSFVLRWMFKVLYLLRSKQYSILHCQLESTYSQFHYSTFLRTFSNQNKIIKNTANIKLNKKGTIGPIFFAAAEASRNSLQLPQKSRSYFFTSISLSSGFKNYQFPTLKSASYRKKTFSHYHNQYYHKKVSKISGGIPLSSKQNSLQIHHSVKNQNPSDEEGFKGENNIIISKEMNLEQKEKNTSSQFSGVTSTTDYPKEDEVRIYTYNILCDKLASPENLKFYKPEDLDNEDRFNRIIQRIQIEIQRNSVICLQEISQNWAGRFYTFFAANDYVFVQSGYGGEMNDYMGCGLAWPHKLYECKNVNIKKVVNTKKGGWFLREEPRRTFFFKLFKITSKAIQETTSLVSNTLPFLPSSTKKKGYYQDPNEDPWKLSANRKNTVIFVELSRKSLASDNTSDNIAKVPSFCVATYHMPCIFWIQATLVIHAGLVLQYLQSLAGEKPLIFAGDFNMKPDSAAYRLYMEGELDSKTTPEYPHPASSMDPWKPIVKPMRSAMKEYFNAEPDCTNYATVFTPEPFIETLDYILISQNIDVIEATPIPKKEELLPLGPFPRKDSEPSDHLPLSATLRLKNH